MLRTIYFFVYGTLKKGQCREKCWPIPPLIVCPAWTFGQLYDLGPHPALLVDSQTAAQRIAGQLWSFRDSDFAKIASVLDQIEGTNQPNQLNEYDRVELKATIFPDEAQVVAHTYVYARAEQLRKIARRIPACHERNGHRYAVWPDQADWPE